MTVIGFDRSHYNNEPDFAAFKAAGGGFIITKGTDGVGWSDPTFPACRAGCAAVGVAFGTYHFAEWGDPVREANYYLSVVHPRPGELVALDAEAAIPAGVDVVAWSLAFCQTVHAACGAWPLVYMNQSWAAGHNWAAVAAEDGLWLAKYDGVAAGAPAGAWQTLAMKQFTSTGTVAGEAGQVDVDAFEGDLPTLLKYAVPGSPPPPSGGSFVSDLTQQQQFDLYNAIMGINRVLGEAWDPATATGIGALVEAIKHEDDSILAAVAALKPVVVDQPAADLIAASLVSNPDFQQAIAQAASTVVAAWEADMARRLGPQAG